MKVLDRLHGCGVVPVVVLDDVKDAVATANALLAGGVDVMEITFRTAAAADSIKAVAENCPDMLVGAGTVITLEQCKQAVECGAKFIVSPGFDEEVVRWCVERSVPITPGCVTPSEIMAAMKLGLTVVKFFPAGVYGGLSAMKALSGPFCGIKFIPTGGMNLSQRRSSMRSAAAGSARRQISRQVILRKSPPFASRQGLPFRRCANEAFTVWRNYAPVESAGT